MQKIIDVALCRCNHVFEHLHCMCFIPPLFFKLVVITGIWNCLFNHIYVYSCKSSYSVTCIDIHVHSIFYTCYAWPCIYFLTCNNHVQLFVMICVLYMWHDISLGSAIKCPMVDYTCTCTCNTPLLSIVCTGTWHVYESKNEDLLAVTVTGSYRYV